MKLFDLLPSEKHGLNRFIAWHLGYLIYVSAFFVIIFEFGLFKSYWFLKEAWIIYLLSPLHTVVFTLISPFRRDWFRVIVNMYRALDGELIFCTMAAMILALGFYLYGLIIWVIGGLIPAIIYS
ncbi:MAG: hypothetical protein JRG97_09975 [Deltaproteobacteria bacterium]|nr:hypothetical protein [Deltaproteobacteria bacterium]MBW2052181.1 hypothetical protein [Deltaproteobacteria bacterium]MBW2141383.1 hypothetical protein [Deltaproteobacteria bacterium]MBW2324758.1 hypothetical protein [Deltaproteobacteria bacterium]